MITDANRAVLRLKFLPTHVFAVVDDMSRLLIKVTKFHLATTSEHTHKNKHVQGEKINPKPFLLAHYERKYSSLDNRKKGSNSGIYATREC